MNEEIEREISQLSDAFRGSADEALAALEKCLNDAGRLHDENPANRKGLHVATQAVMLFAKERFGLGAALPFAALAGALLDLDRGTVVPLLEKYSVPGIGNRPEASRERRAVLIFAGVCVDVLMSKFGKTLDIAAATVAKWLTQDGITAPSDITATTVKNWRDRYKRDEQATSQRAEFEQALRTTKSVDQLRKGLTDLVRVLGKPPA